MSFQKNLGLLLAGILLILIGVVHVFGVGSQTLTMIMGILALVAGILLVLGR